MFEKLSDKFSAVFKQLKGHGKLSEKHIDQGLREVKIALLEADVHYRVVKNFIADLKNRAMGQEVMASLTPGQQIIKIVNEELTRLMGSHHESLNLTGPTPAAIMLHLERTLAPAIRRRVRMAIARVQRTTGENDKAREGGLLEQ